MYLIICYYLDYHYNNVHVSVPVRLGQEAPVGADLAPVPVLGEPHGHNTHNTSASVVFNTNEQKTATIGRVPRVSKLRIFFSPLTKLNLMPYK